MSNDIFEEPDDGTDLTEEEKNRKIELEIEKTIDPGIITGGLCDSPEAQDEFDKNQKGKPPLGS